MGFFTPTLSDRIKKASLSIPEHVMKDLFKNAMCLPHVLTVLVAVLTSLDDIFERIADTSELAEVSGTT